MLFDLNETLVYRGSKVFVRPYSLNVLIRLNQRYDIGIASSCMLKNIESLLSIIFGKLDWKLYIKYIFDRSYTTPHPLKDKPYHTLRDVEKIKSVICESLLIFIDNEESKYQGSDVQRVIISSYLGGKDSEMLGLEKRIEEIDQLYS